MAVDFYGGAHGRLLMLRITRLWLGEMWVTGLMPAFEFGRRRESACRDVMPGPPRHPASFYNQVPDQDVFA